MSERVVHALPKGSVRALALMANGQHRHRRRPRTRGDRNIISRMALVEVARRIAEGRLVVLGPRECELHLRVK